MGNGMICRGLGLLTLAFALTACSKDLTKDEAKRLLVQQHQAQPKAYCGLKNSLVEEKPGIFSASGNDDACISQLKDVGALLETQCVATSSSSGECRTWGYKAGPKLLANSGEWIECGSRSVGDVTSVTNDGKKATAKFTRIYKLDDTRFKLSSCILRPHDTGDTEASATFTRDDSGTWSVQ